MISPDTYRDRDDNVSDILVISGVSRYVALSQLAAINLRFASLRISVTAESLSCLRIEFKRERSAVSFVAQCCVLVAALTFTKSYSTLTVSTMSTGIDFKLAVCT